MLFECYSVPALTYGVDSLFSWNFNKIKHDGIILSFGYHVTHIIPILNNKIMGEYARRLNIGNLLTNSKKYFKNNVFWAVNEI